ncbi:hypothetical protein O3G_MSEX004915 [Manduca sexta]|uniref:Uncharacterized protein n=1 Tax=Manduca sexta TaxID=7130 RepID=A0A922CIQ3_MANSE|nr:hypothetical protein O3G_MSEX004915 [Manduca sexta]
MSDVRGIGDQEFLETPHCRSATCRLATLLTIVEEFGKKLTSEMNEEIAISGIKLAQKEPENIANWAFFAEGRIDFSTKEFKQLKDKFAAVTALMQLSNRYSDVNL